MKDLTVSLNDIRLFVEVAHHLNISRAAEVLNMPNSTLSRRISALEQQLGIRLLHRTTRQISLTTPGQQYFQRCMRVLSEFNFATAELRGNLEHASGLLHISMPMEFGVAYIAPLLDHFGRKYPQIKFKLDLTPRRVNLVDEQFDLVIRFSDVVDERLFAKKIMQIPRHLYAAPDYLVQHKIMRVQDLAQQPCVPMFGQLGREWLLVNDKTQEKISVGVDGQFEVNNVSMVKTLCMQGRGVALLSPHLVADELLQGKLLRLLPDWSAEPLPVYLVYTSHVLPVKTRLLVDYLTQAFAV